jgi:hypothetical protein
MKYYSIGEFAKLIIHFLGLKNIQPNLVVSYIEKEQTKPRKWLRSW